MRVFKHLLASAVVFVVWTNPLQAQSDRDTILKAIGAHTIRSIDFDICLPASSQEYEALGKNGVIKITADSAIRTELPLKSVFVRAKGLRIPLHRLAFFPISAEERGHFKQISFYLIPIYLTKRDATLEADFTGERKNFGIATFNANGAYYDSNAPAFVRLDEYDDPSEPSEAALSALLEREYPDYFAATQTGE
jgi:hypothetical protein